MSAMRSANSSSSAFISTVRAAPRPISRVLTVRAGTQVQSTGACTLLGTARKRNEDRFLDIVPVAPGVQFAAVFDGHGGDACSQWLIQNLPKYLEMNWNGGAAPEAAVTKVQRTKKTIS
jgi:serine/threonine protein phosphatase PrpC